MAHSHKTKTHAAAAMVWCHKKEGRDPWSKGGDS